MKSIPKMINPQQRRLPLYVIWSKDNKNYCKVHGMYLIKQLAEQGKTALELLTHMNTGRAFIIGEAEINHLGSGDPFNELLEWQAFKGINFTLDRKLQRKLEAITTFVALFVVTFGVSKPLIP